MGSSRRWKRARRHGTGGGAGPFTGRSAKMSEVLLDFAEPLLEEFSLPEDRVAFETALKLSAILWNVSVNPPEGGVKAVYAKLEAGMGSPPDPAMEQVFDEMIARGRARYPHVRRMIMQVDVDIDDRGTCRVNVASAELA